MAQALMQSLTPFNPLYTAMYELMCQDLQLPVEGTATHKRLVFDMSFQGPAFNSKGTKVSLNRWFAWLEAASFFVQGWYVRMMCILCIGQTMGIYKSWMDFPLWSHVVGKPAEETEQEEAEAVSDAQAAEEAAAAASAVASMSESHKPPSEDKAAMKYGLGGNDEIQQLRKSCRNTLFVALNIMCKDGMHLLVLLILELVRPFWTEHSSDARHCRDPQKTIELYVAAVQESHMSTVNRCASLLMNLPVLTRIGFNITFGLGLAKGLKVSDDLVHAQSVHALQAVNQFYSLAYHRITSMLWHCACWPGRLAELLSDDRELVHNCLDDLLRDFKIYQVALQKAVSSSFLVNICASSPFCTRVMREIACILTVHHEATMDERKAMVIKYSRLIFNSWGQTKICEYTFKELRDREQRDTTCSNLSNLSYYAYMTNMRTFQMHERVEAQPCQHESEVKADHKDVFLCKPTHQPEGIDIEKNTSRAVWLHLHHNHPRDFTLTSVC